MADLGGVVEVNGEDLKIVLGELFCEEGFEVIGKIQAA